MENVNNVLGALFSSFPTRVASNGPSGPLPSPVVAKPAATDSVEISAAARLAAARTEQGNPSSARPTPNSLQLLAELSDARGAAVPREGSETDSDALSALNASVPSAASGDQSPQGDPIGPSSDLSPEQQGQVEDLERRDAEVRAHEQAHKAAAGAHGGAISYEYETGPNGKRYAVGGSVPIDASEIPNDPQATIQKMQQVRQAALAPADPSGQDRQVAATASRKLQEARSELYRQNATAADPQNSKQPVGSQLDRIA